MGQLRSLLVAVLAAWVAIAPAQQPASGQRTAELLARLDALLNDPARLERAAGEGSARALFCKTCHGKDGISTRPWIPNLAGQNPELILEQIVNYANGLREDRVMNELSASLTDQDILNLTVFYAKHPGEQFPEPVDPVLSAAGKRYYDQFCFHCHGQDGRGKQGYSWLAGQKPEYVRRSMLRYRDGRGGRLDPGMATVSAKLTDGQIEALANYISTLH